MSLRQLLRRARRAAETQQEAPAPVDDRERIARRIARQYAIAETSPLAYYADTGQQPTGSPALLLEEIEWARAWPWIEPEHLRDLSWLADYLLDGG